ncbi:MAG: ferrous iron transport protein B [Sodaliphilus sp.]|nr:ferrous iron transport protein B [Bacteroidales bacterium]MDY3683726.1 ferrous iron transport protein B [Sodaliphilus sp.]MDY3733883.1 ferrous iron transport protein B [Sodaliphilus sp.]MDY4686450.1 ferrous iron transport protein B [Sodaliphilus sp.]MDY5108868.1 ferrous iron transport protein B [Sodaliphilus sp.]
MTLDELKIGQSAIITKVGGDGALRQHFLDMGVIPGSELTLVKFAPMGDPMQLLIHGYELTLRKDDAAKIDIDICPTCEGGEPHQPAEQSSARTEHPGLGEEGRYHTESEENPAPITGKITFALVGNQNCGKTTLFNALTGSNQHVGNFPGVTVDRKSGVIKGHPDTEVVDLPGIYSLSPYTSEEIVSRQFIFNSKPQGIINIVDATNIERNLYLTMQLMELGIPMVLALNMMDEVRNNGGTIDINELETSLGIPVVPISAAKNEGVEELVDHAIHVARYQEGPRRADFCSPTDHGGAVHRCIHAVIHLIEDHAQAAGIPLRFAACKVVEGDARVIEALHLTDNERDTIDHILKQLEAERCLDPAASMADMRYSYIKRICGRSVVKPVESVEHKRSRRIDEVLTGRWTAIPAFLLFMCLMFWLTFDVIGGTMQEWLDEGIQWITAQTDALLQSWNVSDVVHALIIDGVFSGVGAVVSFIPIILTLFFFLSILEDSGYMARIAFVTDKSLRRIGLSGRSIVPLLMGFGCSVPSVMASRTLPSARDRQLTVMLTPFMSCTAKLPIYAFFTQLFFPDNGALVMISLYLLGILMAIIVALVLKNTIYRGEPVPFVMELPNYRIPTAMSVLRLIWDKGKDFMQRAFSVIFIATIVVWFLQSFDFHLSLVADPQNSILASVASVISPIFEPLGFADWRITTSLISGFMAKESVVSTLTVLFGSGVSISSVLGVASAYALLVFCLLYTPCVATIATVRHELGNRHAWAMVVWQCVVAWLVAFAVKLLLECFM